MPDLTKPLTLVYKKKDTNGNPIFEIEGKEFFMQPSIKGSGADHIWQSDDGNQFIFRGPDYEVAEFIPVSARN
jgi:hypothetical protein